MKVLLTNDDGIHAPGIEAMHQALCVAPALGEVTTIAPLTVQSASGHGITFHDPLMVDEVMVNERMNGIAVDGRPADCVKLALRAIWQERFGANTLPDLTVSGMNSGANVGINVIYSGTVAAAVESAFLGVPSIAVSLHIGPEPAKTNYRRAAQIAREIINRIVAFPLERHSVINVNIPITQSIDAPMPEVRVVQMNAAAGTDGYERRISPMGKLYYWSSGNGMEFTHTAPQSDVEALMQRCITITPLTYALTDQARLATWRERLK